MPTGRLYHVRFLLRPSVFHSQGQPGCRSFHSMIVIVVVMMMEEPCQAITETKLLIRSVTSVIIAVRTYAVQDQDRTADWP